MDKTTKSTNYIKFEDLDTEKLKKEIEKWQTAYHRFATDDYEIQSQDIQFEDYSKVKISRPATKEEIDKKEKQLGIKLPPSLRSFFEKVTSNLSFCVYIDENKNSKALPEKFRYLCSNADISLKDTDDKGPKSWAKNGDDDYKKAWQNKLEITSTPNGDVIAVDLDDKNEDKRIVYIDHEMGESFEIAPNFATFFENWLGIGLISLESWHLTEFLTGSKLNAASNNAKMWRKLIFSPTNERRIIIRDYIKTHKNENNNKYNAKEIVIIIISIIFLILYIFSKLH